MIDKYIEISALQVVAPHLPEGVSAKAVIVLKEEIEKRTGIRADVSPDAPEPGVPAIFIIIDNKAKSSTSDIPEALLSRIQALQAPGTEGYRIAVSAGPDPVIVVAGADARGVLYGVGKLLRLIRLRSGRIEIPAGLAISSTPNNTLRGHQLGYGIMSNSLDSWTVEQFDQYIRELAIFGTNWIEIEYKADASPFHKLPFKEMISKISEIARNYGMSVSMWYPNKGIDADYDDPDFVRDEIEKREKCFKDIAFLDAVTVPGGDPGSLTPKVLFRWLDRIAGVLQKYHPAAKIWVSAQWMRADGAWYEEFYRQVNAGPSWLSGVVHGPWVQTTLPEMRRLVDPSIPIRRYCDITHGIICQYPVREWDLAFAMTLGREAINPRPKAYKHIHNLFDEYVVGSTPHSTGVNADINIFMWSALDWDPDARAVDILGEYGRFFIHPDYADDFAQGIFALERNWNGPLLTNTQIEITLRQWQELEKNVIPDIYSNYRFTMGLLRAHYDAFIRRRLLHETELERQAREILRTAATDSMEAISAAEDVLNRSVKAPVAQGLRRRCFELSESVNHEIGLKLSVKDHGAAAKGRGAFMDAIDEPLNDSRWLLANFAVIKTLTSEPERLEAISTLLDRTNPGAGGRYDNFGTSDSLDRLVTEFDWFDDPGGLNTPRVGFAIAVKGMRRSQTVEAKEYNGIPVPLAWLFSLETNYDTALSVRYDDLDTESAYRVRVVYPSRNGGKIRLVANGRYPIHDLIKTGDIPLYEYPIPREATAEGILELTWTAEHERGLQVAELMLIKER